MRRPAWSDVLLAAYLVALGVGVLHPFQCAPPGGVQWLPGAAGLYFEEHGLAHTQRELPVDGGTLDEITFELWLLERRDSRNWGARAILSLYDRGSAYEALLLGMHGRRLFLLVPGERAGSPWWSHFRGSGRFRQGQEQFVAVTLGRGEKAIHQEGAPPETSPLELPGGDPLRVRGRLVLGNAANGRHGWWGEIRGVAIFGRVLEPAEIARHRDRVRAEGVAALANEPDLLLALPLSEGGGHVAHSLPASAPPLLVPPRFRALPESFFDLSDPSGHWNREDARDLLQNVLLFVPLGALLALRVPRRSAARLLVAVTGAGLATSGALEAAQLLIPARASELSDVVCNGLGAALGAVLARALARARGPARAGPPASG